MKFKIVQFVFCVLSFNTFAQPQITFEKTQFNLDTIKYNSRAEWNIDFKNTGDQPLIITNCNTGDGGFYCYKYPKEPVQPGSTGRIKVHYDSKRVGPFNKCCYISSNSASGTNSICFKGAVKSSPLAFTPDTLFECGDVLVSVAVRRSVKIVNLGNLPLVIKKTEPEKNMKNVTGKDTILPGDTAVMELMVGTNVTSGAFTKQYKVYTNEGNMPLMFTVTGRVVSLPYFVNHPAHSKQNGEVYEKQINESPLYFDPDSIIKSAETGLNKFFIVSCQNKSADTAVIYNIYIIDHIDLTKPPSDDNISITKDEMKKIAPKSQQRLVLWYQSFDKNKRYINVMIESETSNYVRKVRYKNIIKINLKMRIKKQGKKNNAK